MQIDPGVYLVGSGQFGFDMTDTYDCNIYLFDAGATYVMFDIGSGMGIAQILQICECDGLDLDKIDRLFLTHAHSDHGGGAAHLRDHLPVAVTAPKRTAEILEAGDEEAVSLPGARAGGIYPSDYTYRACPVEHALESGEIVEIGNLKIEAIATPGHSHDHHSYLVETPDKRYLVAGDAIFFGGKVILQNTYDCSVPDTNASIERLADFDFEALLPGHLAFSLNRGKRHIEAACTIIRNLGCPPQVA